MAKIYISSTFEDLKEFRAAAYAQLRKSRHDVISMEDYNAGTRRPLGTCLADVAACDIYVGLIGWRYGYVPAQDNPAGQSITEREYRTAVATGKEIVILMARDEGWPDHRRDHHTGAGDGGKLIAAWREQLGTDHICAFFDTPDNLRWELSPAIEQAFATLHPIGPENLEHIPALNREALENLSARFGADDPYGQSDANLRQFLTQKAEEYRSYKTLIDGLDERVAAIANLKGAAQVAANRLDFDAVEELLSRVDLVETTIAAETKEARASNALLRNRPQQAFNIYTSAADAFREVDVIECADRRDTYMQKLYKHGLRYGGLGLSLAIDMMRPAIDIHRETENRTDWARRTQNLANALQDQATRTDGPDGTALLAEAVAAYRDALTVITRADHPVQWAQTTQNLANALRNQGIRTDGPDGTALLAEAVAAYRDALTVCTRADHPVQWAQTTQNLAIALQDQGIRTDGPDGTALLAEAVAAYRDALTVRTRADHPVQWAQTTQNLAIALQDQGIRTDGPDGTALLAEAVAAYRDALTVFTRADHPVQWAVTTQNFATALMDQGIRTDGPDGTALLEEAVASYRDALTVRTRADHPVQWAMTQENLARAERALALHAATPNPAPHWIAALAHVDAALEVYDPDHLAYRHAIATRLRDDILARR